jgi:hypothetical protein
MHVPGLDRAISGLARVRGTPPQISLRPLRANLLSKQAFIVVWLAFGTVGSKDFFAGCWITPGRASGKKL